MTWEISYAEAHRDWETRLREACTEKWGRPAEPWEGLTEAYRCYLTGFWDGRHVERKTKRVKKPSIHADEDGVVVRLDFKKP